jgi:hypothetical protein
MMNAERRMDKERNESRRLSSKRSWAAVALLTGGLILSILMADVLLTGNVLAAAPIEDALCEVCRNASDPVQYTYMASLDAAGRAAEAVSGAGLTIGVPSDPLQYTTLVALTAARSGSPVVTGAGLTIGVPSDPLQYTTLVALAAAESESPVVTGAGLTIGVPSDPLQYTTLVALAAAERDAGMAATAARFNAMAECFAASQLLCSIR